MCCDRSAGRKNENYHIINIPNTSCSNGGVPQKIEETLITKTFNESSLIFIAGNFNINIKVSDKCALDFLSLLSSFDVYPSVTDYTQVSRTSKSCIDNIYTNCKSYTAEILNNHISDHVAQKLVFYSEAYSNVRTTYTKRLFNQENRERFRQTLADQDWLDVFNQNESDVNRQWENFMQTLLPIFNQCFPLKQMKINKNKKPHYKTLELVECKNQLDLLLVLSQTEDGYKEAYNMIKRRYNQLLIDSKRKYYKHQIENSDNTSKTVWKIVNTINGRENKINNIQIPGNPEMVSNNLNNYCKCCSAVTSKFDKN